jgi:hypothetical protein
MCLMSYPKVSFERKAIATLKTFSNRNAHPGRAALGAGEKPPVCVAMAGYDCCPIGAARSVCAGFADRRETAGGRGAGNRWPSPWEEGRGLGAEKNFEQR